MIVIHTSEADMNCLPHIHSIVTRNRLYWDANNLIMTNAEYLMNHKGLKNCWKYQTITRTKQAPPIKGMKIFKINCSFEEIPKIFYTGLLMKMN